MQIVLHQFNVKNGQQCQRTWHCGCMKSSEIPQNNFKKIIIIFFFLRNDLNPTNIAFRDHTILSDLKNLVLVQTTDETKPARNGTAASQMCLTLICETGTGTELISVSQNILHLQAPYPSLNWIREWHRNTHTGRHWQRKKKCPKGVHKDPWEEVLSVYRACHLELSSFLP